MIRNKNNGLHRWIGTPLDYWLGLILLKRKQWNKADARFEAAIGRNPEHAGSHYMRGLIALRKKRWPAAYLLIERALFLEPMRATWWVRFGEAEERLEGLDPVELQFSEDEIRDRLEIYQGSPFLFSELARTLRSERKWWQEVEALKSAVGLEPDHPRLHFRLARALEGMLRHGEAAVHLEHAVRLAPDQPGWYYRLGYVLSLGDDEHPPDPEKSRLYFEKAVAGQTDPELRALGIGALLQDDGRWHEAAAAYRELLAVSPSNGELFFRLGMCHDRCYEWSQAEECYVRALAIQPDMPYWHYRLGFVRERQARISEAVTNYQIAAASDDKRARSWSFRLGCVLESLGRLDEACAAFLASRPKPKSSEGTAVGNPEQESLPAEGVAAGVSIRSLEEELALDCSHAESWARLARLSEREGLVDKAAASYRQVIERSDTHDPDPFLGLGRCEMASGRLREACAWFRSSRILKRPQGVSEAVFRTEPTLRKVVTYTEFYETLEIREKTVLYESFHGKVMSCNPYALFLHLLEDPATADWTHVWAVNEDAIIPERFRKMPNVVFVTRESEGYLRHLASAKLLVNNVSFPACFIRKDGQIYLNTWHGTPWKMMGADMQGEFLVYGNVARNFLQATHLISSNRYTTDILLGKYHVDVLFNGVAAETGYPRIDLTLRATAAARSALRKRLGIPDSAKVILYAPTWRGTHGSPQEESDEVMREVEALQSAGGHVLFRGHTLSGNRSTDINVPEDIVTNELLAIVDVLVTDYSSIWFDFIATGRPVVFYLKDLEEYTRDRGLYFGVDELPGEVAYHLGDLAPLVAKAVRQEEGERHPRYAAAVAKFCPAEDGFASRRVLDLVFSGGDAGRKPDARKSILMFGGGFLNNGITSSLLNLLNAIDHTRFSVTLAVEPGTIADDPERRALMARIPAAVRILPRHGGSNTTLEERMIRHRVRRTPRLLKNPEMAEFYMALHSREFIRLFGTCRFDAVMDLEGYNTFWSSVLGGAPAASAGFRSVYQHNDKIAEWKTRFPQLELMFYLYPYFDRILSVSKMTMERNIAGLCDAYGLPPSKFDYVENTLDAAAILARAGEALDPAEEKRIFGAGGPVFVTVGRLSIEKDHAKLIHAFATLVKSRPAAKLVIVGDGPLMSDLKRLVARLKLEGSVFLVGRRMNPFPFLRKSDCFVLSSNHEGQPMVLLEAFVLNLPIVSTDIVGARGVLEGRSGHLVENSVEGLVRGMTDFIEGRIEARPVDVPAYQESAIRSFYRKSCSFTA